ncbi:MAG: hypothetical protein FVQ84_07360 [Planctomycetes bacterium]|nr:hypothetical protein [Planctomycetota bacterium]
MIENYREQLYRNAVLRLSLLIAMMLVVLMLFMSGCAQQQVRTMGGGAAPTTGRASKEELRQTLDKFGELSLTRSKEIAAELYTLSPTARMQKTTLLGMARIVSALHSMLDQEDPIVSLIDTWSLCVRMTQYFETGEGSRLFGDHQDKAIKSTKQIELEIEQIGKKFLSEAVFRDTREYIHTFARANPIRGTFSNMVVYATEIKEGETSYLTSVIDIPMAPFKAMGGVDRTATAIHRFTDKARDFSDVVEAFPESARWQLLLLLYDLEETEMAKSFLASLSEFSQSSARIADSTEKLPKQLREQTSILIEEIDSRQKNLQTTLDKAEKTAAIVERSITKADEVADSFGRTANSVNEAATAWDKAAEATNLALKEFSRMKPARKDPNSKASFNINDYRDTAEAVAVTANDLRTLMAEFREFITSDDLAGSSFAAQKWTNHLAWRIVQLVLTIFVLALVYRIVVVCIVDKWKKNR